MIFLLYRICFVAKQICICLLFIFATTGIGEIICVWGTRGASRGKQWVRGERRVTEERREHSKTHNARFQYNELYVNWLASLKTASSTILFCFIHTFIAQKHKIYISSVNATNVVSSSQLYGYSLKIISHSAFLLFRMEFFEQRTLIFYLGLSLLFPSILSIQASMSSLSLSLVSFSYSNWIAVHSQWYIYEKKQFWIPLYHNLCNTMICW